MRSGWWVWGLALAACTDAAAPNDEAPPVEPASDTPAEVARPQTIAACVRSPSPAPFRGGDCPVALPAAPDAVDEALASMETDRCHVRLRLSDVARGLLDPRDARAMPGFASL